MSVIVSSTSGDRMPPARGIIIDRDPRFYVFS